jgi:selenocysteine lyase/cysteine desulfurase
MYRESVTSEQVTPLGAPHAQVQLPGGAIAHRHLGLEPAAICRLSFYIYNSPDDVDAAVAALAGKPHRGAGALESGR